MIVSYIVFIVLVLCAIDLIRAENGVYRGGNGTDETVNLRKRIVGGSPVTQRYPWMATIRDSNGVSFCAGSLVAPFVLVTAAHCVAALDRSSVLAYFSVSANRFNLQQSTRFEMGVDFAIVDYVVHPSYQAKTYENDLCIMKLVPTADTVQNTVYLSYIPLDATDGGLILPNGQMRTPSDQVSGLNKIITKTNVDEGNYINPFLYVAGWGRTSTNGQVSPVLLQSKMLVAAESKCQQDLNIGFSMTKVVCAVGSTQKEDTCQGDSGGPLFTTTPQNSQVLIGVVSFGIGCASVESNLLYTREIPGAYTSVYFYQRFIKQWARNFAVVSTF